MTSRAELKCERCSAPVASDAMFCSICGASRARPGDDEQLGKVIGDRYLLRERLGHGRSGTIYLAEHVNLRRRYAVKLLHHELSRDEMAMERFRREATTVAQIDNEHIVEVADFGRAADGRLFLAMEYLEGEPLLDLLTREKRLPIPQVVDILIQLGEALMEAHAMGYVHRDLRPRNVFLTRRRNRDGFVKLLDFGLAKLVAREGEAATTSLGMTFGDPRYMSPEQAHGDPVDRRADLYSLGIIAYEMLVGRVPFTGEKVFDVLTRHLEEPAPPPSQARADVPPWLDAIVLCMLAKRPDERFVTVYRLVEALRDGQATGRIMSSDAARSSPPGAPPDPPAPRQRETALVKPPPRPISDPGMTGSWFKHGEKGEVPAEELSRLIHLADRRRIRKVMLILGSAMGGVILLLLAIAFLPGQDSPAPGEQAAVAPDAAPLVAPSKPRLPGPTPSPVAPSPPPAPAPAKRAAEDEPPTRQVLAPSGADAAQAEFFIKLGQAALKEGDLAGATASFNKARGFDSRNADAIAGLGEVALRQGFPREAAVHAAAAVRLAPTSARIQRLLGQVHLANDQVKLAARAFRRSLEIDPDDEAARRGYQEAVNRGGE